MTTLQAMAALAAVGQLALVLVAVLRGAGSPLTLPLALLFLDLFTWNAAAVAYEVSRQPAWGWLDVSTSPLTVPFALDFVLAFVGLRRRLRWLRGAVWAAFGLLAGASALAFVWTPAQTFGGSDAWAALLLGGAVPVMVLTVALLAAHLRAAADPAEKARARLLLAAIASATVLASTELWGHFYPWLPGLSSIGLFVASTLTTIAAMRLRLLERAPSPGTLAAALAVACAAVAAYLALFRLAGANTALLVFGTAAVSLALMAATRRLAGVSARRRARVAELTLLGRFSAQMAHDLKNPLAALKGAAQVLQEQLAREGAPEERGAFVRLMLDQVDRIHRTIDRYQRLSHVEPVRTPLVPDELVREVLALQGFASDGRVAVRAELGAPSPWPGDRELLGAALENLLKNAVEAMPDGGTVTVRTGVADGALLLSVEDEGTGMDARTRERAFDEFFTTKAAGSGLGLSFVRRVAEAHGGRAALSAREGRGTVVTLRLPLQ